MKMYESMLWKSYSLQDREDFLIEQGCNPAQAQDYSYREFDSLPFDIREAIEKLENF